jgi:predicted DNA-binding protein (MmcQ/YjbR family)
MGHPARKRSRAEQQVIQRVADICATWANVTSGVDGFGHMTFRAGKKPFVIIGGAEDGSGSMAIKSDLTTQDALIRTGRYMRTPYIGQHGWVSADFGGKLNWNEIESLIADAYENIAPKQKVKPARKAAMKRGPATLKNSASKKAPAKKSRAKKR